MAVREYTDQELLAQHERREQTHLATLSSRRQHAVLFEPYGVTHMEYRVLALLYFSGGGEPSVMADKMMVLRQTMTKLLDSLESKGLCERAAHPSDRRKLYVRLLPEGQRLARKLMCIETDFLERIDTHFTEEELTQFHAMNERIRMVRDELLNQIVAERRAAEKNR